MKSNYKEVRTLSARALCKLCIENGWYRLGPNEEYRNLLYDMAESKSHITTDDIIEIAEDIISHSELALDCDITYIAAEVNRVCSVRFENM